MGDTLAAVHFVDTEIGYAAGFLAVLKTVNGGVTWQPVTLPANAAFVSVFAKSATEVFVGRQSLFRSVDGGISWREFSDFPGAESGSIFDIKFTSNANGYLVKFGQIFRTQDGGDTWEPVFTVSGLFLSAIEVPDDRTVYAMGGITYDGHTHADFIRSYDGGDTWEVVSQPGLSEIMASAWVGPREGYVFTFSQQVLKTIDGGDSWTPVNEALGEIVMDASFRDAQTGFAVCYSGTILSTTNGGLTWATEHAGRETLSALARPCGGIGYAVGNGGQIFKRVADPGEEKALRIAALNYNSATGEVELSVQSSPCKRYRIEASKDLVIWAPLAEHVPEKMDWQIKLPATGTQPGFFRIAQVQSKTAGD
jgi:photosystem II stability/assembly factor-like uncharacterized protein